MRIGTHRCRLQDGCLSNKHRHRSAVFTPSADKKCRRQACMKDSSACGLRMTEPSRNDSGMKRKMSKGFAVSLYKSGGFFIGLQHLVQQGIQQSAVRRIVPPSISAQPETVAVQAGEGSSGQGNAGAVRVGWFPLRLPFFLTVFCGEGTWAGSDAAASWLAASSPFANRSCSLKSSS